MNGNSDYYEQQLATKQLYAHSNSNTDISDETTVQRSDLNTLICHFAISCIYVPVLPSALDAAERLVIANHRLDQQSRRINPVGSERCKKWCGET